MDERFLPDVDCQCLRVLRELTGCQGWQYFAHPTPSYGVYVKKKELPSNDMSCTWKARQVTLPCEEDVKESLNVIFDVDEGVFFSDETGIMRVIGWHRTPRVIQRLVQASASASAREHAKMSDMENAKDSGVAPELESALESYPEWNPTHKLPALTLEPRVCSRQSVGAVKNGGSRISSRLVPHKSCRVVLDGKRTRG